MRTAIVSTCLCASLLSACSEGDSVGRFGDDGTRPIPLRYGSVMVEACLLDPWQTQTLTGGSARRVIRDVVLVCPAIRSSGVVYPEETTVRATLSDQVDILRKLGYSVRFAVTLRDEFDWAFPAYRVGELLDNVTWRATAIKNLAPLAAMSDGLDLDFQRVRDSSAVSLTAFANELAASRPGISLGLFAPPSVTDPSDLSGASAYDIASLSAVVDRIRVMTLDFSSGGSGGPGIDTGWAVDAVRLARSKVSRAGVRVDATYPLFGTDFSNDGERSIGVLEAKAIATITKATLSRGPTGTLHFTWIDLTAVEHNTWYDDTTSTLWGLSAWDTATLPSDVGVGFYGLGAEDPTLWDSLARGMR